MGKPGITTFGAANTIEDLNTTLDAIADRFDGNIDDTDVNSISYSKLDFTPGTIKDADIAASADIDLGGISTSQKALDASVTNALLALNAVEYDNITAGATGKFTFKASTGATTINSGTDTEMSGCTVAVTALENSTNVICIAVAKCSRTNNNGSVEIAIQKDGVDLTNMVRPELMLQSNGDYGTVVCVGTDTTGTASATFRVVGAQGSTGSTDVSFASGDVGLWIVQIVRSN